MYGFQNTDGKSWVKKLKNFIEDAEYAAEAVAMTMFDTEGSNRLVLSMVILLILGIVNLIAIVCLRFAS